MTLDELRRQLAAGSRYEAEIISVEGAIYLVRLGGESMLTAATSPEPLRFRSAFAAGQALGEAGVDAGWLVHESPYDEMIGRTDEALPRPGPLRTRMTFGKI